MPIIMMSEPKAICAKHDLKKALSNFFIVLKIVELFVKISSTELFSIQLTHCISKSSK